MAKHVKMSDGAHHIVVAEARIEFMKEKGYLVEGDHVLEPGHLVGHIRVRKPAAAPPAGHVGHFVEMTDGHIVIRSDKNWKAQHDKHVRKGFIEMPSLPALPDVSHASSVEGVQELVKQWAVKARPIQAMRDAIKNEAKNLDDGRAK